MDRFTTERERPPDVSQRSAPGITTDRSWLLFRAISTKLSVALAFSWIVSVLYRSGLQSLAVPIAVGGCLAGGARLLDDYRRGIVPWLPTERQVASDAIDSMSSRATMLGTLAGGIGSVLIVGYALLLVYDAGSETFAVVLAVAGGIALTARVVADYRRGLKPWLPTRRVQVEPED